MAGKSQPPPCLPHRSLLHMAEMLPLKVWLLLAIGNSFFKGSVFMLTLLPHGPAQMLSHWLPLGSFLQSLATFAVWSLESCTYLPSRQTLLVSWLWPNEFSRGNFLSCPPESCRDWCPSPRCIPPGGRANASASSAPPLVYIHFKAIYLSAA